MKIVLANKYYYLRGGAERYVLDLERLLGARGHETAPFAMRSERNIPSPYTGYFVSEVQTERVRLGWQGLRSLGRMIYSREAKRNMQTLVRDFKPDVCHVHNIYYQISPSILVALHERGIPTVMTVHDYHMISPQYMRWSHGRIEDWSRAGIVRASLSRFHKNSIAASFAADLTFQLHRRMGLYRLIDRYIAPTHFVKNLLTQHGFPESRIHVLPYGIDAQAVLPRYQDEGYILFVGRLVEEKGVWQLMRAARLAPGVKIKVVGTGPEEERMHLFGDRLSNVEFLGFQSGQALWDLYRGARAVVVPSIWEEVFGFVALEAMAAGKPVIATAIGGLPEVVEDRFTGLLVRPNEVKDLAEAMQRLADDPALARDLGMRARQQVLREHSVDRHYQGLMQIYEEAIREHRRIENPRS